MRLLSDLSEYFHLFFVQGFSNRTEYCFELCFLYKAVSIIIKFLKRLNEFILSVLLEASVGQKRRQICHCEVAFVLFIDLIHQLFLFDLSDVVLEKSQDARQVSCLHAAVVAEVEVIEDLLDLCHVVFFEHVELREMDFQRILFARTGREPRDVKSHEGGSHRLLCLKRLVRLDSSVESCL